MAKKDEKTRVTEADKSETRSPEEQEQDREEREDREDSASRRRERKIERGNRRAEAAEAEDPAEREERIREGQVFEDLSPHQDDPRRRLKVLLVEGEGDDAPVLVENLVSRVHSRIRSDRLLSDAFQRSV
jgi:hypothetical protein